MMRKFKYILERRIQLVLLLSLVLLFSQCKKPASLSAVIVTDAEGQVSLDVKTILENTGLFDVDIVSSPSVTFSNYDVVLLHLAKANWTDDTKSSFISYVNSGGGVVSLSGAAYAFGEWSELDKVLGVSTSRSIERSKVPYEFKLTSTDQKSPVNEGLATSWLHSEDYLSFNTATLVGETEVLATAWADTIHGGDGAHLPVIFTVKYGEGRVFHSTLGMSATDNDLSSIQCVGFVTTLQRGAEWAATGVVSQEVPVDFPNSVSTHHWTTYRPLDIDEILKKSMSYEVGKSKKYLSDFSMRIRSCDGKAETYAMFEDKILNYLDSEATVDSKKYMCRELSWIGSEKSISALEKLVNDKDLSESASYALQRLRM